MKIYEFPTVSEETGYRIFSDCLENDPQVFFHGTAASNLASIARDGFSPSPPLCTVSFSSTSPVALRYASDARENGEAEGCIIVVRFPDLNARGLNISGDVLHDAQKGAPMEIMGYCIVPAAYRHV